MAVEVAQLARRVAAHQEMPQDIEWALTDGEVVLLQARPITALPEQPIEPVPVSVDVPEGYWEREASHAPKPWTPMSLSVAFGDPRNQAFRRLFAEFGLLAETLEFRQIGGWEYSRLVPLGGKDRPAPPAFLMPLLTRLVPDMRRRIAKSVATIRTDKPGHLIDHWYEEWQPDLITRIARLRDVDLAALDDQELDAAAEQALELMHRGIEIHFTLHGALMPILAELAFTCYELLGWSDQEVLELLAGLSSTSTQPAHRLAELARLAADRPAVSSLLTAVDRDSATRLADADPGFARAFDDYQRQFSCRALRYEIAEPSLAETPELTLRLLADQVARTYDPDLEAAALAERRAVAKERARAVLAGRPSAERDRFERALARAERAYPVREDNEFFTASVPLALVRYRLLEIGRRLGERTQIDRLEDIFFLNVGGGPVCPSPRRRSASICQSPPRRAGVHRAAPRARHVWQASWSTAFLRRLAGRGPTHDEGPAVVHGPRTGGCTVQPRAAARWPGNHRDPGLAWPLHRTGPRDRGRVRVRPVAIR